MVAGYISGLHPTFLDCSLLVGTLIERQRQNQPGKVGQRPLVLRSVRGISLPVTDKAASMAFYRDVLGLVPRHDGKTLEMSLGGFSFFIEETDRVRQPCSLVFEIPIWEILDALDRIKTFGISVFGPENIGDSYQVLYLRDPDGHRVEIRAAGSREELRQSGAPSIERPGDRHDPMRWKCLYDKAPVNRMPWYTEVLDREFADCLGTMAPLPGRFLELGCGAGTAASRLAALGYEVVALDIAPGAICHAKEAYGENSHLAFKIADVLEPMDHLGTFDYIFDRGCFHTLPPEKRDLYISNILSVLKPAGRLFLKVFSRDEPGDWGPFRFSEKDIREYFKEQFIIKSVRAVTFVGNLPANPKGIFVVLERKSRHEGGGCPLGSRAICLVPEKKALTRSCRLEVWKPIFRPFFSCIHST